MHRRKISLTFPLSTKTMIKPERLFFYRIFLGDSRKFHDFVGYNEYTPQFLPDYYVHFVFIFLISSVFPFVFS